jgi:hypothetical protein
MLLNLELKLVGVGREAGGMAVLNFGNRVTVLREPFLWVNVNAEVQLRFQGFAPPQFSLAVAAFRTTAFQIVLAQTRRVGSPKMSSCHIHIETIVRLSPHLFRRLKLESRAFCA